MKTIKFYLIGTFLLFGTINVASAQAHSKDGVKEMQKLEKSDRPLNLTEEQKIKMKELKRNYDKKFERIKTDENLKDEERAKAYKELRQQKRADFDKVLTDEQRKEMKERNQRHRTFQKSEMKHKRPSADERAKHNVERLDKTVNLTEDQKKEITKISKEYSERTEKVWKDENLTQEQRKEQMKKLNSEKNKAISNTLTEPQQKKLEEAKKEKAHTKKSSMGKVNSPK